MCRAAVEACCDAPEVLELVETALDGVTDLVCLEVVRDQRLSGGVAGDDRLSAHAGNKAAKSIGIIGLVGENATWQETFEQGRCQRCVAALAGCKDQLQWPAECIHGHVYLGRQSSEGRRKSSGFVVGAGNVDKNQ